MKRKFFIACDYDFSRLESLYPSYKARQKKWKPVPEVILKLDDLYARALESDFGAPIFDADQEELSPPYSGEVTVEHYHTNAETCSTPGTAQEKSRENIPQTDGICDGKETDHYRKPDAEMNSEQHNPNPINPRSTKCDKRDNPKLNCNDDYR